MCGIAGVSLHPNENVNATDLTRALLLGIEERGWHATGVAWADTDGDVWLVKDAVTASEFVKSDHAPADTRTVLAHTRWATKGAVENNANNHPIDVGGIVGIHNGCLSNDDELFAKLGKDKRIAQVDSEAIFAHLLHSGLSTADALQDLRGSAAIGWLEVEDGNTLHLARVSSSPLVLAFTDKGSLLFASTAKALTNAAVLTGLTLVGDPVSVPEGTYFQVRDGKVVAHDTFTTQGHRTLTSMEREALRVA